MACQFHPEKSQAVGLQLDQKFWIVACVAGRGLDVGSEVVKARNKRTIALRLTPYVLTLIFLVLAVVGCSGSKVTTKSSAELSRYQIRTIALVPFTTLATPQVRDVADPTFSVPTEIRRTDTGMVVPPNIERSVRQTVISADWRR